MVRAGWIPLVLALSACGPASVTGVVDGERIGGARDAIFDTVELDFGFLGEVNILVVILSDIPNSCEVYEEFFETIEPDCEERCDDYEKIAQDYLGAKEYWQINLTAVNRGSFEDDYDYEEGQLENDEFQLNFLRYDAEPLYDTKACEDECLDGDLLVGDQETGNGGELEITEYDSKDFVKGKFQVDMGGDEDVQGAFTADYCNMSEWLPWL